MFNKDVVALWEPGYVLCNINTMTDKINYWYDKKQLGRTWISIDLVEDYCLFEDLEDAKKMLTKIKNSRYAEVVYE